MKKLYNLGAGSTPIDYFTSMFNNGWQVLTVDIKEVNPDIVSDIRDLKEIETNSADAVWLCHVLEHFYWHEIPLVLNSILRILKPDGFGIIRVPDLGAIANMILTGITDTVYETQSGLKITPLDMIYGSRYIIENASSDAYRHAMSHKIGFTDKLMNQILTSLNINGFIKKNNNEIIVIIYKTVIPDIGMIDF
ncbi:MAG: class I SAM-dependent methyltransferase [Minisyncoccia bacterium]|jgi:predicted SAM-dependent methyltransferase